MKTTKIQDYTRIFKVTPAEAKAIINRGLTLCGWQKDRRLVARKSDGTLVVGFVAELVQA